MYFFKELQKRNRLLFGFGLFNLAIALACIVFMQTETMKILGANRWLKPFKFYSSVGIMVLTLGWLMHYLDNKKAVLRFSIIIVFAMLIENGLILMQAIRGTTSHFNISSAFNILVFNAMGILILVFTITCIIICIRFFRQKEFTIPIPYAWGIRLGILFFIIFSLEGGVMLSILKHTVGAPDGGPGLPITNWSSEHGDLRIAHFLGIHSLQVLPLTGYYIAKSKKQMLVFSSFYFVVVMALLVQALADIPLIP
jgi:hypothetical protein